VEVSKKIIRKEWKGLHAMHKNSQKGYISRSHGGGTQGSISMKVGALVYMVNIVISAKFDYCSFSEQLDWRK
jgi:hypothetical protein